MRVEPKGETMDESDEKDVLYTQSRREGGVWKSPWSHNVPNFFTFGWHFLTSKNKIGVPDKETLDRKLPVVRPYWMNGERQVGAPGVRSTWIGHATVLAEVDKTLILCDPIFSAHNFVNLPCFRRYRKPACTIEELPDKIAAVVISHTHYDHMDSASILQLHKRYPMLRWFVPKGVKSWFASTPIPLHQVSELEWWEEDSLDNGTQENGSPNRTRFIFTPANHHSRRTITDANKCLWGSWAIVGNEGGKFWFGGDTAYCSVFQEIGRRFGSFNLSAIPIGAYEPNAVLKFVHVNPNEAVQIHKDIGSLKSMAIHWGTFRLSHEYYLEPKQKIEAIVEEENNELQFEVVNIGETVEGVPTP